jgi:RHS repeat-associated protein
MTDAMGNQVSYGYDAADRLIKTTLPGGEVYQFGYDANGNRTQVTMPNTSTHQLTYTPIDLQSTYTPPNGSATTLSYDTDRELIGHALISHGTVTATYDAGNRPTGMTYADGSVAFHYASGDPTSRVGDVARTLAGGAAGQDVAFGYAGPLVTSATWTQGSQGAFSYTYDNNFFLTGVALASGTDTVSTPLTRDADGLLTGMGNFSLARNGPGGALGQITDPKLNLTLGYDNLARPASRSDAVNALNAYSEQLTYDAAGRITGKTETVNGTSHTDAYQYDKDGQLTKVTRDGGVVEQYAYDVDGNRISRQLGAAIAETATYDAQDRLTQRGAIAYQYDADGFLMQRGTDTFTYSARGELLKATIGSQTITYSYDGLGRRVGRTDAAGTTQYLYGNPGNALQLTQQRSPAGQLTTFYYDDAGFLIALDRGGTFYYVATDQVGTPHIVTDALGAAVRVLDYDAFGDVIADSNPNFDLPIGFAGGVTDPVTGLVRFGYRDYEPASGRWTARDPALFGGRQGNLYAYVGNNPVGQRDVSGLFSLSISGYEGVGGGLGIGITSQGISLCGEVGFGFGGGASVDPFGGLAAEGNTLIAQVGVDCGPLSLSAGVSLNHCGDLSAGASGSLSAGPVSVGIDSSGNTWAGLSGELGPLSGSVDSQGNLGIDVKTPEGLTGSKPSGFNGGCSIGGKIAGQSCARFAF